MSKTRLLTSPIAQVIVALVVAAAPAYAKDVPAPPEPVASCSPAPAAQALASVVPQVLSDKPATIAERVAATVAPGIGRPVSVQNRQQATKDMVFLDKVATSSAKVQASIDQQQGPEECTELGLVWDPSGPVGCSDSLGACFETDVTPCTDASGIPEDTFCASWACRWW